jgi:exodeoxyribonuclease V beta subunit
MTAAPLDVFNCPLDGISLIEASAGTGKTWNICGLYLRLLLERGLEVQQILVVTFTNAATAELRDRIRNRIVETLARLRATGPTAPDAFVDTLLQTLRSRPASGLAGASTDEARALRLDLALQTFDEASIFTIHGFCQRALGDAPFTAGMPMALELLTDDAEMRLEVVHDFWRRRIAGRALAPARQGRHAQTLCRLAQAPARQALVATDLAGRHRLAAPA